MPFETRIKGKLSSSGPFLAEVTNHLDPTYMGRIEVALKKGIPNSVELQSNTFPVKYLSPFYGVTSARFEGNNSADFNDVQKSYGMWMMPPDVGTTVLVIFVDGDPNQGYWIGCVPDKFQNHMVPGIAASKQVALTTEQIRRYGTDYLPVAEFNKKVNNADHPNVDKILKPVHPFADRLLAQGLLLDNIRGVTSSSARREVPSSVFGISTPGPLDSNGKKGKVGYAGNAQTPVSRLGGTTFVMDDGDINGQNELVRIRTRTGHQILLHNSQDLVYIANSKGTAWIELTSSGKIDVYAEDSISMRTKGDFNLRADRDFNIEAGRNFNVNAAGTYVGSDAGGNINLNSQKKLNIISDELLANVSHSVNLKAGGSLVISTAGNADITATGNINVSSSAETRFGAGSKFSIYSGSITSIRGATDLSLIGGSTINIKAPVTNLFPSAPANQPTGPQGATPETPSPLNLYTLPQRDSSAGWANGNFYKSTNIVSIMQRVPTHEPWDQHESTNPTHYTLDKTDTQILPPTTTENGVVIESSPSANVPYPASNGPGGDRGTFRGSPLPWTKDQSFLNKVKEVAAALTFDSIDLLAIINLESARTFDPAITNSLGYTGLIQFGKDAAKDLGTTTDNLRQLNRIDQMDYVYAYFHNLHKWPSSKCPTPTLANLYLTVLLPAFKFYPADTKIADASDPKTKAYYLNNRGFDPKALGYFTPSMVETTVLSHKREVLQCLSNNGVGIDLVVPNK